MVAAANFLNQPVDTAIILAGGKGERLRPLTDSRPKCMVEVLGRPIISYQLQWLKTAGIKNVVVACGYMHQLISEYCSTGARLGLNITYCIEDKPLGRGGALKAALHTVLPLTGPVITVNGDQICNLQLAELVHNHSQSGAQATLVTVPLRSPYGIVQRDEDGRVRGFVEKPELPYEINAGIYVLNPEIFDKLPDLGDHEDTTFPLLATAGKLNAFKAKCFWRCVDTIKDLVELTRELPEIIPDAVAQANIV